MKWWKRRIIKWIGTGKGEPIYWVRLMFRNKVPRPSAKLRWLDRYK